MREVTRNHLTLGSGPVKVAVPLLGKNREELFAELRLLPDASADLIEWRIDCLSPFPAETEFLALAREVKRELGTLPLLITFRSSSEGGKLPLDAVDYAGLQLRLAEEKTADLLDVELFSGLKEPASHIAALKSHGIPVIASRHFFSETPPTEVLRETLTALRDSGADIPKLAVMTKSTEDLLTLLAFSAEWRRNADRPFVLIGMGTHGVLSRISGAEFGSCLSFGALRESSAPGQLPARELKRILSLLPEYPVPDATEPRK